MPVQAPNPFGSFLAGREARQEEQYGRTRNALAQLQLEQAPVEMERRNRLADLQIRGLEQQYSQEQITNSLKQTAAAAARLAQSANPRGEAGVYREFMAKLREQNPEIDQYDDAELKQYMGWIAGEAQAKLGIAPTAKLETLQGDGGSILQRDPTTGALKQVVAPQKPDHFAETQAAADRRAREAREHAERMAQQQQTFTANQNDLNRKATADLKTETANVKERVLAKQNQKAYDTYVTGMKGLMSSLDKTVTGPFAGRFPALSSDAQIANGAVAAMAPVLKSLFRAAGEGTFTDKDQDVLMAMLPTRADRPDVVIAKAKNIDAIVRAKLGMAPATDDAQGNEIQSLLDKYAPQ